jgi:uncharacterized protein YgiM (DUF1202 family)
MTYAVVAVPAAPVRRKPRHQREMTSQLLFGEKVKLLKEKGELWVRVQSLHDGYEGWMTRNLLWEITEKEAKAKSNWVTTGHLNELHLGDQKMHIPFGASLPGFVEGAGNFGSMSYGYHGFFLDRKTVQPGPELVVQWTHTWLNAPYLWGGRTVYGVDCSGFAQVNYKMMGIDLPRDAWQQAQEGRSVKKLKDALCGDLAFFDDRDEIVHVGILLGVDTIIHASGKVRVDTIDKKGIIHSDTGKRTHALKSIKRFW